VAEYDRLRKKYGETHAKPTRRPPDARKLEEDLEGIKSKIAESAFSQMKMQLDEVRRLQADIERLEGTKDSA
jgi:hypothetical protein